MASYRDYNELAPEERRNRRNGVIAVVCIYLLLLIFFRTCGLKHMVPPPPEYGIELDMSGGGGGGSAQVSNTRSDQPAATNAAPSQPKAAPRVSTQRTEATPKVTADQPKTNTTAQAEPTVTQPTVNENALFKKKPGGSTGSGTGSGSGQGSGEGPGSGSGSGGGVGSGSGQGTGDFWLDGRPVVFKAYPKAKENTSGKVIVEFRADRDGKVIYAKAGVRGTTINDVALWAECERAAKSSRFKEAKDEDTPAEQRGKITYRFVIR